MTQIIINIPNWAMVVLAVCGGVWVIGSIMGIVAAVILRIQKRKTNKLKYERGSLLGK